MGLAVQLEILKLKAVLVVEYIYDPKSEIHQRHMSRFERSLVEMGYNVRACGSYETAFQAIDEDRPSVVICPTFIVNGCEKHHLKNGPDLWSAVKEQVNPPPLFIGHSFDTLNRRFWDKVRCEGERLPIYLSTRLDGKFHQALRSILVNREFHTSRKRKKRHPKTASNQLILF